MRISGIRLAAIALMSGIVLSGCAYDMYGDPYGYGYGYGPRSSISIGVGYGGYGNYGGYGGYGYGYPYGGYGYGGYGGHGYPYGGYGGYGYPYGGYGYDPFGWYGDYYYPGTGIYVYDRSRTRHVWSGDQQDYWTQRRQQWRNHSGATASTGENWSGWDRSRNRDHTATSVNTGTWSRGSANWNRDSGRAASSATTNDDGTRARHGRRHGGRDD